MNDDYGLIIAQPGRSITDQPPKFTSVRRHLSVDLEANPRHMDIIDRSGGTALFAPGDAMFGNHSYQETLVTIPHKLGFTPLVVPYFYVLSSSIGGDTRVQQYAHNTLILSGTSGTISDMITWESDTNEVRIVHRVDSLGTDQSYTSNANQLQIRIKYYIAPIDLGVSLFRQAGVLY